MQCSRGSKKDFWRCCEGGLRSSQDIPSTHHKLISPTLHYLPFASRFPLPHFTLVVLFALSLSLYPPSLSLFASFCPSLFLSLHGRPPHLQMVPSSLVVFFLGTTAAMKPPLRSDQISTTARPLPGAPKMSVETTPMGSQESLLWLLGRGVVRRAGLTVSTRIVYPGSGREDA